MNELLLIILISFVVFISGCTQTQLSLNQTLSSIGQVNSFLSQYPNSTIQSVLLSTPPQNLVNQLCGTNLTLSNVYFVNITNQQLSVIKQHKIIKTYDVSTGKNGAETFFKRSQYS